MIRDLSRPVYLVDPETGCWLWQRGVGANGYATVRVRGKNMGAHRFFFEAAYGPIPDGLDVDHVRALGCRHRHCVNPDHLEAVTRAENVRRGSICKLTFDLAEQIRAKYAAGDRISDLAAEHDVSQRSIRSLLQGRTWRGVAAHNRGEQAA